MQAQSITVPVTLVGLGMICTQLGAAVAKGLFPALGATGTTTLRLVLAALILVIVFRPWRFRLNRQQWRNVLVYGVVMGVMNLLYYAALERIPLGITVALEFTGPLAVALFGSRRPLDLFWIVLAVAGLAILLPIGQSAGSLDPVGVFLALCTGACWAAYIIFGQRAGTGGGPHITALGLCIGAVVALPIGISSAGTELLNPSFLPLALAVALLSSAIPYVLDIIALPKLPARLYGILMSGQPALATLFGLIVLHEALTGWQTIGIAAIIAASVGATLTTGRGTSK